MYGECGEEVFSWETLCNVCFLRCNSPDPLYIFPACKSLQDKSVYTFLVSCQNFRIANNLRRLCDNALLDKGASHLLDALSGNQSIQKLSLMHTGLGDSAASELAARLALHGGLQELNVAYNNIGDGAALKLVDACREHPTIHTLHLYLNQLTDVGKQSLHVRGVPQEMGGRRVKVLASVTEGSDISEDWLLILSIIGKNSLSWERERVHEQLLVFLKDLEWGRKQHSSFWKKLHFRKVERVVRQTQRLLEKRSTAN